jgi:hypothetical protein
VSDSPPPSLLSRRIGAAAQRLSARHPDHAAARLGRMRIRPVEVTLDTTPPDLTRIDPDPAHIQRCKVTEDPKPLERPPAVDDQLEVITPQFFLRNTERLERYADVEWLEFEAKRIRDDDVAGALEDARRCTFERPDPRAELASARMRVNVAERRVLMLDTPWSDSFGRREVVARPESDEENGSSGDA